MVNELITVEQKTVLTSRFDDISKELDTKLERVNGLLVTEDDYKDAKKIRAELNKESKSYADEFKDIKQAVLKPWNEIESEYKEKIAGKYQSIDLTLKSKINDIEDGLKAEKKTQLEEYFNELKTALNIDFVDLSQSKVKVNLSTSLTGLKKDVKNWLEGIDRDIKAIGDNAELLAEYQRNGYQLSLGIQTIAERKQAIRAAEEARARRAREAEEEAKRIKEAEEAAKAYEAENVAIVTQPVTEESLETENNKQFCVGFKVYGNLEQLKALKAYLIDNNLKFEQF